MNIAMISLYVPSGSKIGVGYQAHYLANALVARGHCVTMFSPDPASDGARYRTVRVPVGTRWRTFRFAWELRNIDFGGFDVIHAHTDDYWLWRRRAPCHVRTMHGSCLSEALHIPGLKEKVRMLALAAGEVLSTALADRTVAVSSATCRSYPWIHRVIPNGVDLRSFHPGPKDAVPTILFVGTYRNRKRGRLLVEAFEGTIRPRVPSAQLWMVCEDAPASPGVTVFGRVSTERLADLYRRAWVFCLPSSYEGFGVPYIEAMASGTPVVATPNPGAVEVLAGGRFGVLAEPADLGTAIADLLQDEARRSHLAQAGIGRAATYSLEAVIDRYENVYRQVLSGARPALADLHGS